MLQNRQLIARNGHEKLLLLFHARLEFKRRGTAENREFHFCRAVAAKAARRQALGGAYRHGVLMKVQNQLQRDVELSMQTVVPASPAALSATFLTRPSLCASSRSLIASTPTTRRAGTLKSCGPRIRGRARQPQSRSHSRATAST